MSKPSLRSGFTTGTCAAAAAKAAAVFLLTGRAAERVTIHTPQGILAELTAETVMSGEFQGYCRVRKDAGDDPDVTHGSWIYGKVAVITPERWQELRQSGQGYTADEYPGWYLTGGPGIGIVTKPGLSCPVGRYAINPVPRKMIMAAAAQVWEAVREEEAESLEIRIAIPAGIHLAEKTFNPRLGIVGGISVLGTSGIVEPMSEQALLETIRLDIRMKVREREGRVILTPGNYGAIFLQETMGIPLGEAVKCSNFIADALEFLVAEGAGQVLLAGHIGKLIKVTGGARNTHSCYGDRRMELLAAIVGEYQPELTATVQQANTTEEVMGLLVEHGLAALVLDRAAELVKQQAERWLREASVPSMNSERGIQVEVVTFSSVYGILGKTRGVQI